jgi:8-oxo-dGTP pyrophosphatase MutT (NUDIX family)
MAKNHVVAKVLLVNTQKEVLVLRRSETDQRRPGQGDIPGGWVDPGEDFTAAAIRETEEEAGITLRPDDLQLVYTHTASLEVGNTSWLFFVGKTNKIEFKISSEHDQAQWVTLDEAIEKIPYKVQNDFLLYVKDNKLLENA